MVLIWLGLFRLVAVAGSIHIGTSGWSYKDWRGPFYPDSLASKYWLSYYAGFFDTVEVDSSFYRLPTEKTVKEWVGEVPKCFKFCPKMSRYLTQMKKLKEPEEPLERYFSVFDHLKDHLGPVLVQLPPQLHFDAERTEHFFKVLRKKYSDHDFTLEVRHDTWMEYNSLSLIRKYNIGLVISQSGVGFPYAEMITAKNIYVRFHGPGKLYGSRYSDKMLQEFAGKFKKWEKEGHAVWAFFNNDQYAYAPMDALRLKEYCGIE